MSHITMQTNHSIGYISVTKYVSVTFTKVSINAQPAVCRAKWRRKLFVNDILRVVCGLCAAVR